MKLLISTLFLLCFTLAFGQQDHQVKIDPSMSKDTVWVMLSDTNSASPYYGRGMFYSWSRLTSGLASYINGLDTAYVNSGDSLVLVIAGDTTFFEGGSGSGLTDGDKGDISVTGTGLVWNIDTGVVGDNELSNGLNTNQLADGTVSNTEFQYINSVTSNVQTQLDGKLSVEVDGDPTNELQDLSGLAIDANVVHKTGDETVAGEKTFNDSLTVDDYAIFKGLSGGLATKVEMLKDGTLCQSLTGGGVGDYLLASKIMPIQAGQNNTSWNVIRSSFSNTGIDKNNETVNIGFNLGDGGGLETDNIGETGFGLSFESHYRASGSEYNEFHLFFVDTNNVQWRPMTFFLNKYNPQLWVGAFQMPRFELRPPSDTDPYFKFTNPSGTTSELQMLDPTTNKGATFTADPANSNLQIANNGMTNPTLYTNTFYVTQAKRLIVESSYGGDPTALWGWGSGFGSFEKTTVGTGLSLSAGTLSTTAILPADTAAMLSHYIDRSDTTAMLAHFVERSDTSSMLSHYIERQDTASMLLHFVERADTASMLTHYIERQDTASMLSHYIERVDTAAMLTHFVERADTASMLLKYARLPGRSGGQTLIGGTGTQDDLILRSTSGTGIAGAEIQFQGGTNGATRLMTMTNAAAIGISTITSPVATYLEMPGSQTSSSLKVGAFECQSFALNNGWLSDNIYYNAGTGFTRRSTGYGCMSYYYFGAYQIRVAAASGSAGSTFTPQIPLVVNRNSSISLGGDCTAGVGHVGSFMMVDSIGKVGIGTSVADKKLEINLGTSDAFRLTYNDNNGSAATYVDHTVSSAGVNTLNAVGTTPSFVFTDPFANTATSLTLGAAATTFALTSNVMTITGNGGGNTLATITGGFSGQILTLIFVDANVTITDNATGTANTINIGAAFTSTSGDVLTLVHNGTSWFEKGRSVN